MSYTAVIDNCVTAERSKTLLLQARSRHSKRFRLHRSREFGNSFLIRELILFQQGKFPVLSLAW